MQFLIPREMIFRRISLFLAKALFRRSGEGGYPNIFILTPTACGSLGDEAMVRAAVARITEQFKPEKIVLLIWGENDEYVFADLNVDFLQVGPLLSKPFGVSSAFRLVSRDLKKVLQSLPSARHLFILGADVLDGKYSETRSLRRLLLAEIGHAVKIPSSIVGFSFSDKASNGTRLAFERLPHGIRLACRDPISAKRVRQLTKGSVEENADLAFLLQPRKPSEPANSSILNDIEERRESGKCIVAVNVNRQAFGSDVENNLEHVVGSFVTLLRKISSSQKITFLLIPHDFRGKNSDEALLKKIMNHGEGGLDMIMASNRLRADEAKYLVGKADITITGRMHLAIASISMGVPSFVHDYQGKVYGLLSLFNMEQCRFTSEDLERPEILSGRILSALGNKHSLVEEIKENLPRIKSLSERNIFFNSTE